MDFKKITTIVIIMLVITISIVIPLSNLEKDNKTIDVIVMAGQSNACYLPLEQNSIEIINEEYPEIPTHNLYYYGNENEPAQYGQLAQYYSIQPMYSDGWNIHGYGPILCNEISKRSNHDVLYINIGSPGRTVQQLSPEGMEGQWGFSIVKNAINEIYKQYNNVNMLGFCWAQGEGDYFTPVSTYKQYFNEIQTKFSNLRFNECYVIHTRDNYGGNSNIALNQIAIMDPDVMITCEFTETYNETNGYLLDGEPIHYSQSGRNLISMELGNIVKIPNDTDNYYEKIISIFPIIIIVVLIAAITRYCLINRN